MSDAAVTAMPDDDATIPAPVVRAPVYEHPWVVRLCHWTNAVVLTVLVMSGLQIFFAFPSFGPKIPEADLVQRIPEAVRLGGWLGGALQWHFTFMWIFAATAALYGIFQLASGHFRTVLFVPSDIPGVWPMIRHYFLFGPKPAPVGQYNPLQKLAYTSTLCFGALSLVTGSIMYKPVQLSGIAWLLGGYHTARLLHFAAMVGFLAFIPGHLIMVTIHGWDNFRSMLIGWKLHPDYVPGRDRR
jgi:thiosulfate reductase cytochrome b subunit